MHMIIEQKKEVLQTTYVDATKRYSKFKPLIKYIEDAMMDHDPLFSSQS